MQWSVFWEQSMIQSQRCIAYGMGRNGCALSKSLFRFHVLHPTSPKNSNLLTFFSFNAKKRQNAGL